MVENEKAKARERVVATEKGDSFERHSDGEVGVKMASLPWVRIMPFL